jgi:hypothetical protein
MIRQLSDSRSVAVGVVVILAVLLIVAAVSVAPTARASAQASSLTVQDAEFTADEPAQRLVLDVSGDVRWSNFRNGIADFYVVVHVKHPETGEWVAIDEETHADVSGSEGTHEFRDGVSILGGGTGYTASDFFPDDGEETSQAVQVRVSFQFTAVEEGTVVEFDRTDSATVTVQNPPDEDPTASATVTGTFTYET